MLHIMPAPVTTYCFGAIINLSEERVFVHGRIGGYRNSPAVTTSESTRSFFRFTEMLLNHVRGGRSDNERGRAREREEQCSVALTTSTQSFSKVDSTQACPQQSGYFSNYQNTFRGPLTFSGSKLPLQSPITTHADHASQSTATSFEGLASA